MKIFVKVKTNAKTATVKMLDANHFAIAVKNAPVEGKANAAVIAALAKYLKIPKARLKLVRGLKSKQKILEIL